MDETRSMAHIGSEVHLEIVTRPIVTHSDLDQAEWKYGQIFFEKNTEFDVPGLSEETILVVQRWTVD